MYVISINVLVTSPLQKCLHETYIKDCIIVESRNVNSFLIQCKLLLGSFLYIEKDYIKIDFHMRVIAVKICCFESVF